MYGLLGCLSMFLLEFDGLIDARVDVVVWSEVFTFFCLMNYLIGLRLTDMLFVGCLFE